MKFLQRDEFRKLLEQNPGKRFAFYEYRPDVFIDNLHVTLGDEGFPYYGATTLSPVNPACGDDPEDDILFCYDWNLMEDDNKTWYAVLDIADLTGLIGILQEASGIDEILLNKEGVKLNEEVEP